MLKNNTLKRYSRALQLLTFGLMVSFLAGCFSNEDADQPPTPDVSGIQVKARIERFDQDLFAIDTTHFREGLAPLAQKYPVFMTFFMTQVTHDMMQKTQNPEDGLYGFVTAPQVRRLYDTCQTRFTDLGNFKKELTELLKFYKYYYPERPEMTTVAAVTEFVGDAYVVNDTLMMLGMDLFLGENFEGYNPEVFPQYMRKQFKPENMIVKYGFALSNNLIPAPAANHVLDHMIRNGKVLYLMDCLLPSVPDSVKMGYSGDEWAGSLVNEQEVWGRLLDMKVLYEPLGIKNMKIVTAGPSSDNVFQEAPGQIGNFIGWQIVKAYMKRYPKTTIKELSDLMDAQKFLEKAKYKPKKR